MSLPQPVDVDWRRGRTVLSSAHGSSNKYIFSLPAKVCTETDAERMLAGKLFHTRGPATKLHVPKYWYSLGSWNNETSTVSRSKVQCVICKRIIMYDVRSTYAAPFVACLAGIANGEFKKSLLVSARSGGPCGSSKISYLKVETYYFRTVINNTMWWGRSNLRDRMERRNGST